MSQEKAKQGPPPKPMGAARPDSSGLKIVTMAPGSAPSHDPPGPPPSSRSGRSSPNNAPPPKPSQAASEDFPTSSGRGAEGYIGCTIDNRYKVEGILGEGGMGVVYECRHKIIDKRVAMKILRADLARDKEVTERFLIEARAASSIGNEHIIDISDFGQLPDGSAYFVMEFLEGAPLSAEVEGGNALPAERITHIAIQLCDGLEAAHEANIVHRDLKPDNIYLIKRGSEDDFVKILDFGIAKVTTGAQGRLTQAGSVFGTPHYMAPEQAAGAPVDHRGDIYSLGVILYELASGQVPFDADNFMGILTQHMYKAPVPIRALVPETGANVPPGLEAIILKCLSKRAEQRYQTTGELRGDLERLAHKQVPAAVGEMMERSGGFHVPIDFFKKRGPMAEPVPAEPLDFPAKRSRWPLYLGIAAPFLIAGGIFFAQSTRGTAHQVSSFISGNETQTATDEATGDDATEDEQDGTDPETEAAGAATEQVEANAAASATAVQIVIGMEPAEAHAFLGDEDLGTNPVLLDVPKGETLTLEVKHKGYKSQTIEVDGSEEKLSVSLDRKRQRRWVPQKKKQPESTPQKKKKSTTVGGGEIVNPWD